jgi:hypothetical protein
MSGELDVMAFYLGSAGVERKPFTIIAIMPGHSRPKHGVASARLCPGIHV